MLSERMKRIAVVCELLILVVVASCFIVSPLIMNARAQNPDTVIFRVEPPCVAADVGDTFTIECWVFEAFYIYSWQVIITWNDAVLTGVSADFGGFLADQPEGSATNIDSSRTYMWIIGESTLGKHMGKTGDGLLFSMTFEVLSTAGSALTIDSAATKYYYVLVPPTSVEVTDFIKENGQYVGGAWPEDINGDAWIDIFDIAYIGRDYGASPVQTRSPSACTGGWPNPTNAYSSDDSYADVPKNGEETYYNYGFITGLWIGVAKVEVGVEAYSTNDEWIVIEVSGDAGSNWGTAHNVAITPTETLTWVDVTSDLSWTPSMLSDANFRVRGTGIANGGYKPQWADWLPVRVVPTPTALSEKTDINGDGIVDIGDLTMVALKFGDYYGP